MHISKGMIVLRDFNDLYLVIKALCYMFIVACISNQNSDSLAL